MKIVFDERRTKRDGVVFYIVAETDSEGALLSLLYDGFRWLQMEELHKTDFSFGKITVSQKESEGAQ